ncbi:MAG: 4'-phosphopantetheinyl transferase superfamily protein [Flavobacteriaceae bacterium]|nr:4'-phosphopantetheinyl transferase superfamily protein [Bacteroidia bacterium]NNL16443.1 4'-phosphopantetheinyl transferase superfamily protein [Flavobacteriaceae bacterium]
MPLYKTITPDSQTIVKIWKITESYEELLSPLKLKPETLNRVSKMKSGIHQCGFLSVRHLLAQFGYSDQDLFYDENGKPHLVNDKEISITHSFNYSAIIISENKVGIDIEKQRPIITKIASKFVDYEFEYLKKDHNDYVKELTVIWCVKESLYKLFATKGLSFKKHIMVIPFTLEEKSTVCWIDHDKTIQRYMSHFFEFDGFTCAYVLQ